MGRCKNDGSFSLCFCAPHPNLHPLQRFATLHRPNRAFPPYMTFAAGLTARGFFFLSSGLSQAFVQHGRRQRLGQPAHIGADADKAVGPF